MQVWGLSGKNHEGDRRSDDRCGDELDANQAYEKTNDEDDERDGR